MKKWNKNSSIQENNLYAAVFHFQNSLNDYRHLMNLLWWKGPERFHDVGKLFVIFIGKSAGAGEKFIELDGKGIGYFFQCLQSGTFLASFQFSQKSRINSCLPGKLFLG